MSKAKNTYFALRSFARYMLQYKFSLLIVAFLFIADAVLAGGIRRAALISLFNMDDDDMLTCKHGAWWELNPQRGRANNSAVILRHKVTKEDFNALWEKVVASGSGEPGVYFSNDKDWGTNPCCLVTLAA